MKKILTALLCLIMILPIVGCKNNGADAGSGEGISFSQTMTIARMPSPPKCKIVDSLDTIERVLEVLSQIEKGEMAKKTNGWYYLITLNVDGTTLTYSVGEVFTDADGSQYMVLNYDEIKVKLDTIYDEIAASEKDYA